jgi:transposase
MKEDPGYEAVMGITERRIASGVNREDMNRPDITGIDEIALKKGHNNSVTIITSYSDGRAKILGVVGGREKQTAEDFLSGIPERLRTGGQSCMLRYV